MMPIGKYPSIVIILAASCMLLAQTDDVAVRNHSGVLIPDARQIVEASIAATQRHWQVRPHYTYVKREESRRLDAAGRVKSQEISVSRTVLVNGVPYEQLVERDGQPPSVEEQRTQKEKLHKLMRETPAQRDERLRKQEDENTSLVREVPKAFDFQFLGEEEVNGRPAYVLQATPHPGYQAQGKYGKMFSKVTGKLWIDKQDLGWVKVDGYVIQPFSMGLFLARVLCGSHITLGQIRLDNGIWMLDHIELRAAAKIFFVKSLVIDRVLTYSEYRLSEAGIPTTSDSLSTISWPSVTTTRKPR
jgi:hypothetical protein